MDLLPLLLTARAEALNPEAPDEIKARLADLARGEAQDQRQAVIEALIAGYPAALREGGEAAARIAALLPASPLRSEALSIWRAVISAEESDGSVTSSRWQRGAILAARAEVVLVVAALRTDLEVETLAVALLRDGREISCWIDRPTASYAALLRRLAPEATAVVGYDLPRLLTILPDDLAGILSAGPVADLATSAEWLAARGRLAVPAVGLEELAKAAGTSVVGDGIGARIDAAKSIWFRLLRPRLLD